MIDTYISREALDCFFDKEIRLYETCPDKYDTAVELKGSSHLIPAADVRPVVTCEECVWHVDDGCHNCTKLGMLCPDDADFYCKYGRRPKCGTDMREES